MKLPRTIRLDPSDTFVFATPAEPGRFAVTGSFLFLDADPETMTGKERAAFRAGFADVEALGFSTLVVVSPATAEERDAATEALAMQIAARFSAPTMDHARAAAAEEIAYAASLCAEHAEGTLIALHRTIRDGRLVEQFRTLRHRDAGAPGADRLHSHAKAFIVVESEDEEAPEERVDLVDMMKGRAP
ncbi:DUF6505 family protein [Salinarimonas chemoclinalis]|uniref:DUF6505 family protein n=1 Tax=Salinarimonas chemoclinalis TaxID=3241599 RepID=UPI00355709F0